MKQNWRLFYSVFDGLWETEKYFCK